MVQNDFRGIICPGSQQAPTGLIKEQTVKRRGMSGRKHGRKFNKSRNRQKAINSPAFVMRGGIRL